MSNYSFLSVNFFALKTWFLDLFMYTDSTINYLSLPPSTMSNMSYCRFQNTLNDLRDCSDNFTCIDSKAEFRAMVKLLQLCTAIVEENERFESMSYEDYQSEYGDPDLDD